MSTGVLLYWISRLDGIHTAVATGIILTIVMCASGGFFALCDDLDDEIREKARRIFKKAAIFLFIFIAAKVFIPTTRDALIITGVGGTVEYLKSNETATQLPDRAIKALDKFFDEYVGESYQFQKSAEQESI